MSLEALRGQGFSHTRMDQPELWRGKSFVTKATIVLFGENARPRHLKHLQQNFRSEICQNCPLRNPNQGLTCTGVIYPNPQRNSHPQATISANTPLPEKYWRSLCNTGRLPCNPEPFLTSKDKNQQ